MRESYKENGMITGSHPRKQIKKEEKMEMLEYLFYLLEHLAGIGCIVL